MKQEARAWADPNPVAVEDVFILHAEGLPLETAINLWVTPPGGVKVGSPLGSTPDGTFAMNEFCTERGNWLWEFTGPTRHKNTPILAAVTVEAV